MELRWLYLSILVCCGVAGCAPSNPWDTPYPATGSVTFKGKAVENAELTLFPTDPKAPETVRPRARTTADGKFVVTTYQEGDGAPVGQYKVTIIHNEVAVSKDTIVAKPNDLPVKYSKLESTDLNVTIVAGKNEIPAFELR